MYSVMKHDTVDKILPQGILIFAINKNKRTVLLKTHYPAVGEGDL